jgi:predicted SprT family Zn-dependent metalloprotease
MQLDFLTRLTTWTRRAAPVERAKLPASEDAVLTTKARQLLLAIGCDSLAARVRVRWNARMRTTAGLANYRDSLVTLNPKLAQFGDAEIDKTLRHELAHLLAHFRAGRRRIAPHGAEWKQACRDLGLPDEKRCHNLPLPRRNIARKHVYRCENCRQEIKRVRPFRRRVACLECCRAHNRGRYHENFRLVKIVLPSSG